MITKTNAKNEQTRTILDEDAPARWFLKQHHEEEFNQFELVSV